MTVGDHTVRRESDEYYCFICRKRWDVHDEPPPCAEPHEVAKAKWEEAQRYERAQRTTIAPPAPPPTRWPADKQLIFRMIRSAENHHPDISEHFKGKVLRQYRQWKQEQMTGTF